MQFLLHHVFPIAESLQRYPAFNAYTPELLDNLLEECGKFCSQILAPLNASGDAEGVHFANQEVRLPKGFTDAYRQYVEAGWMSLTARADLGGQDCPHQFNVFVEEMLCASNLSFSLLCALTRGVSYALAVHGTPQQVQTYVPKLVSGEWCGVMCLTEAQAGSDLSLVNTLATPQTDGSYLVHGTKIFITNGEHDATENIIHLVLARTPDAPTGVKGISLFLVPKLMINADGSLGERNAVYCESVEHKMGIKASPTCVMRYEQARGFLVGTLHEGLAAMFTVMNIERLAIGIEGLGLAQVSYENAVNYARTRLQGRAPNTQEAQKADPIIEHPDIRRMLLTMRAYTEAGRALAVWAGRYTDQVEHETDPSQRQQALNILNLFIPIVKASFTDIGFDMSNLGLQVFGGHGYIREWGMEQFVRDARIAQIYEGTNGIQAFDLLRRKVVADQGKTLFTLLQEIRVEAETARKYLGDEAQQALQATEKLNQITSQLIDTHKQDPALINAVCVDYLQLCAHVFFAHLWLKMMVQAQMIKATQPAFAEMKILTGTFFFAKLLPKVEMLAKTIAAGTSELMNIGAEAW
jgi:alkylation response protein AidB-like acyl-CoA dehydrogenase